MNIKDILAAFGIRSSLIAGLVGGFWLIGITPIYANGNTLPQEMHSHFVRSSPMDFALNNKIDIQEFVQGYEYQLNEHIRKLDRVKADYRGRPSDLMIELERWKAEKRKIENKLQDWRNRATDNRAEIEMIAGRA